MHGSVSNIYGRIAPLAATAAGGSVGNYAWCGDGMRTISQKPVECEVRVITVKANTFVCGSADKTSVIYLV